MSGKKEAVLLGYSGHGLVVAEAALSSNIELLYYADKRRSLSNLFDLQYIGFEGDENFRGWNKGYQFILGIGDNETRHKMALNLLERKETTLTIIHPSADISKSAGVGSGVFISRNVSVNPLAIIGDYTILNTGSIIEHECKLGNAVHIAPGAVLAGNVEVGDRSFIGANAVIKQGVKIGENVIIGAGAVVITDIPDGKKFAGNPARSLNDK